MALKSVVSGRLLFTRVYLGSFLQSRRNFGSKQTMVVNGPRPLVLCGPSGSGKSTLLKRLMDEFGSHLGFNTTRKPRPGELHQKDYYFVERNDMEAAVARGEFLETAEFSGNLYGTSKQAVEDVMRMGRICILDIDVQGVKNIKKTDINPRYVFIKPPSEQTLEDRLRARKTETEESLQRRLSAAKQELDYGEAPGNFDIVIVNDAVEKAYEQLRNFILEDIRVMKEKKET
uniref:guanylate kinase n=1 Tax=Strigamia maritima TaxID=126957 RepID=T1JCB9_STRMM